MPVLVQKYGGSSVADVEKIGRVADRVVAAKRAGSDVVVVVSAMGKTTDSLIALARSAAGAGAEPPRRELDMLLSTGERVSMALLSIAIHARGEDAISFTGSQSGIITNDRHFDARIIEVRAHRIEDELARGKIVIVAGYQGMSYRREITTLGRGGTDTTAVALAAALGADRCEIYSDVDGVYSADPRVVSDPIHLPELDLAVLQEMAEAGAKVVNAQAVEWARRAKITLAMRRTSDPLEGPARETLAAEGLPRAARAVVGLGGVVHAAMEGRDLPGFLRAAEDLPLCDVALGAQGASCAIPLLNVPDWADRRRKLERDARATFEPEMALVSVVGDGLGGGAVVRFLGILGELGASPRALAAGPLRIGATIPAASLSAAERALHTAFVVA
jgi:aspartate kinase